MSLLRLENISLAFGEAPLLDKINLQIDSRERIFLIGRNGMGKSCLLKIIKEEYTPDGGKIYRVPDLKIAGLSQNLLERGSATVYEVVAEGLVEIGSLLNEYHRLIQLSHTIQFSGSTPNESQKGMEKLESSKSEGLSETEWLRKLEETQRKIEAKNGWQFEKRIETILTELELPADKPMNTLSGGWQRRVDLARALVSEPDLLLLDEPTNHLDLLAIEWLEEYLKDYQGAVLCITHDRTLLRKLSQRILELDRGKLTSWIGNYDKYLIDKEHRLEVESKQMKLFDTVLAQEEAWIRQGVKARRTRNEGRVRALEKLRQERKLRREIQDKPKFTANQSTTSGDLVIKADDLHYTINEKPLIQDFSIKIFRGDKIALVGPNGVGKTTLLRILLGKLKPDKGHVELGTNLEIGYFDQLRAGIDPTLSAIENVAGGREFITVNGKTKHAISYLSDFLFTPDRARTPVTVLSGGECNRLLLAKLFSLPTNLLILDEPTNDLDIESLELLESLLVDYTGTILIVSHDRSFVDEVATSTLYFQGLGKINEYVGGYSDIPKHVLKHMAHEVLVSSSRTSSNHNTEMKTSDSLGSLVNENLMDRDTLMQSISSLERKTEVSTIDTKQNSKVTSSNIKSPMSSKLKRELESLPEKIAKIEKEQLVLQNEIAASDFYNKDKDYVATTLEKLKKLDQDLSVLFKRWEELENYSKP